MYLSVSNIDSYTELICKAEHGHNRELENPIICLNFRIHEIQLAQYGEILAQKQKWSTSILHVMQISFVIKVHTSVNC